MFWTYVKQGAPDLSEFGDVYQLGFGLGQDKPPTSAVVKKEFQRKIIYHLSPHEVYLIWAPSQVLWSLCIGAPHQSNDEDCEKY